MLLAVAIDLTPLCKNLEEGRMGTAARLAEPEHMLSAVRKGRPLPLVVRV